jgi:hypothetical protein
MADLRAMTSGLESKSIGSGGGAGMAIWSGWECVYVCRCGGPSLRRVGPSGGVMGDMGGGTGEEDRDRGLLLVEMVRAGIVEMPVEKSMICTEWDPEEDEWVCFCFRSSK